MAAPGAAVRRLASDAVFAGSAEVLICHRGVDYRLRQTTLGKLILTKKLSRRPPPLTPAPASRRQPALPKGSTVLHEDLSAEDAPPSAGELLERQLSALLFLLTRCACRPDDAAAMRLALEHLELLGRNGEAPALVRRTASRVAKQWREEAEPAGESAPAGSCCRHRLH